MTNPTYEDFEYYINRISYPLQFQHQGSGMVVLILPETDITEVFERIWDCAYYLYFKCFNFLEKFKYQNLDDSVVAMNTAIAAYEMHKISIGERSLKDFLMLELRAGRFIRHYDHGICTYKGKPIIEG